MMAEFFIQLGEAVIIVGGTVVAVHLLKKLIEKTE